jgi:hypothetical protein
VIRAPALVDWKPPKKCQQLSPDLPKCDIVKRQLGDVHRVALRFIASSMI